MNTITLKTDQIDDGLFGIWKMESKQTNGQPIRREEEIWSIGPQTLTYVNRFHSETVPYFVDKSKLPLHLTAEIGMFSIGIYEVIDDALRIAMTVPGYNRPSEFETQKGDLNCVSVFHRIDFHEDRTLEQLKALFIEQFGEIVNYPEQSGEEKSADEFISDLVRKFYNSEDELTSKQKVIYQVSWLMTEIKNGGINQYFYNSTGDFAEETVGYLNDIGAPIVAKLIEECFRVFPGGTPPENCEVRRKQMDEFTLHQNDRLDQLESQFYLQGEELNTLLKRYWERNV